MQKRLAWIDQLKGLAILLVIIGHLIIDSGIEKGEDDPVKWFIYTFHMPLFFFLSGLVMKETLTGKKILSKLLMFLAPFFVVGTCYICTIGLRFFDFIYDTDKFGYWYLFVLAIFYIVHFFMTIPQKWGYSKWWGGAGVALGFFAVLWGMSKVQSDINGLLSLEQMYFNWPFFISGYFLRKYIGIVKYHRRYICPLSLVTYIIVAVIFFHTQVLGSVTYYLRGMCMISFLIAIFYDNKYIEGSVVGKKLASLGTKTLDIYIYHYFIKLFIGLTLFGSWIEEDKYYVAVIILSVILAVVISYMSIYIGKAVRLVPVLRNVVYGRRFK